MKNLTKLLTIIILILAINTSYADNNKGYKIKFKINGISDTIVYLGHHYGNKKLAADTARVDKNGVGEFQGNKALKEGIYFIIMPSIQNKFFEIIIGKDQTFSLETDTTGFIKHLKIKGSTENQAFLDYQNFMTRNSIKSNNLRQALARNKNNKDSTEYYKKEFKKLNKSVKNYLSKNSKNPDYLLSSIIKAMQEIEIPESNISKDNPKKDSLDAYNNYIYRKNHFFDNIDLSDERLLRTPIFHEKLNTYVKRMLFQHPDTLIKESRKLLKLAETNDLTYRYILRYFFNYYEKSRLMSMDRLFVHISDEYYLSGKATWADSSFLAKLDTRVKKMKPNLIGNTAVDLKLQTPDDKFIKMSEIDAKYLVIIFWEPHCGHCKKTVPKLFKEYQTKLKSKNVKVYAIDIQTELEPWKNFIEQKDLYDDGWFNVYDKFHFSNFRYYYDISSTPIIYLLDKDKKIIGKRLSVEQIANFIDAMDKQ